MDETHASPSNRTASLHPRTIRFRGLPNDESSAQSIVQQIIATRSEQTSDYSISIIPASRQESKAIGLVKFPSGLQGFLDEVTQDSALVDGYHVTFDRHFFGFTQLSRDTDQINADVIAIGGLAGHAYGSWQSRQSPNYMWLQDFLPQDLHSIRVMIYGYSAELAKYDHATLDDYAKELLEDLSRIRGGEAQDRPVVFLAHSFGGIVLERALLLAERDSHSYPNLAPLLHSLRGLMLFAVPHGGMDVNNIRQVIGPSDNPRHNLIQYISSDSEKLEAQRNDFKEFVGRRKRLSERFMVYSFYETEPTPQWQQDACGRWKRSETRSFLLTKSNAMLGLTSTMEIPVAVHKDHSDIIKFHSDHDDEYTRVRERLRPLLDHSTYPIPYPIQKSIEDLPPSLTLASRVSTHSSHVTSDDLIERHSRALPPSDLGKVLIRVVLVSAMVTASVLPDGYGIAWPWKRRGWTFWGVAIPTVLLAATCEFAWTSTVPNLPRENSQD